MLKNIGRQIFFNIIGEAVMMLPQVLSVFLCYWSGMEPRLNRGFLGKWLVGIVLLRLENNNIL